VGEVHPDDEILVCGGTMASFPMTYTLDFQDNILLERAAL